MSFGQSMAFHPLIDMLRRNFRIEEDDSEEMMIEKIAQRVLRLDPALQPILPYLRYLFAVDPGDETVRSMDPKLRRAELFDALRRLLLRAAEDRPQVLVFEDLHWMDKATEAFLTFIAESIPSSRVLCLFTYRPGYVHPFGDRTYHTRVVLSPLSTADTVQMAQAMLATERLPDELAALIAQKAEGNPFFAEEVVKSLRETGAIRQEGDGYILAKPFNAIEVPDTIQDILMARIDRLQEPPKKTLQLASVIGREFTHRLLDRLADIRERTEMHLEELKAIELIYEKSLFPELAYMFKHALTQDVAYNSLLEQRRQELHRLIGQGIEALYADRLAEQYEVLAYHFARGEAWAKALEYYRKAAEKATRAFATREAVTLYEQALEVVKQLDDAVDVQLVMNIHNARAGLFIVLSDFQRAREAYENLLILARQEGDRIREAEALVGMGTASIWGHDIDQSLADALQAIQLVEDAKAPSVLAAAHNVAAIAHAIVGHIEEAEQACEHAIRLSRSAGDVMPQALTLCEIGHLRTWSGAFIEALPFISESIQISRDAHLLEALLHALWWQSLALTGAGDYDAALKSFEEGLALSEKVGNEIREYRFLNGLGWLYFECGALDRAIALNQKSAEGGHRRHDLEIVAQAQLNLADIYLAQGELTQTKNILDGVYQLTHDPATSEFAKWRYAMHLFASLGELWLARGDVTKAREFADQCLDIASRTNSRKYVVRCQRLRGEIALSHRQRDEAREWLREALSLAQEVNNPTQLWKTHLAMGHLHAAARRPDMARQAYEVARKVIDRMKANLQHPELHAGLDTSPLIQHVYDLSTSN